MAVSDVMVLLTGMVPEMLEETRTVLFKELHPFTCKLEKFAFYSSADTSVWILVLFTVDRFVAVCYPLKKSNFCLPSRAKICSFVALLFALVKNVHVFWTRGSEYRVVVDGGGGTGNETSDTSSDVLRELVSNCGRPTPEYARFEKFIRPWIAFTLVSVLPFTVILLGNVAIIRALLTVRRVRAEHSLTAVVASTTAAVAASAAADKSLLQMTAMCMSASFCFLACITPSIVLLIGKPYWASAPASANPVYDVAKAVNNQLVYVNHSVNFLLYCVTGKRFRAGIAALFHRGGGGGGDARRRAGGRYGDSATDTSIFKTGSSSPERARRTAVVVGRQQNRDLVRYEVLRRSSPVEVAGIATATCRPDRGICRRKEETSL